MRARLLLLTALPLMAGCQVDLTGLDLSGAFGGGRCCYPAPALTLHGTVRVDEYAAAEDEVTIYFYEPGDTIDPVDSTWTVWGGHYTLSWSQDPTPGVCDWLGRAVLWSGEAGALEPVFADDSRPCDASQSSYPGPDFAVEYTSLVSPFTLTGRVLAEDRPAQLEVTVEIRPTDPDAVTTLPTATAVSDSEGVYRFETMEAAQRFVWCQWAHAMVSPPQTEEPTHSELDAVPDVDACGAGRTLPDFRLGADKAVRGYVGIDDGTGVLRRAGAGEATVTLLDPADSTQVVEPVKTLDDGTFHIWHPVEMSGLAFPGCDFDLEVELDDGSSVVVPLLGESQSCAPDLARWVVVE